MVGKITYYKEELYARMQTVAKIEFPSEPDLSGSLSKLIQTGVKEFVEKLEEKHGIEPPEEKGEDKNA